MFWYLILRLVINKFGWPCRGILSIASMGHTLWAFSTNCWQLTHWDRMTHICVSKLTIIGSDNGLSPVRCQAIIWTNAGILLIGPLGTSCNETSIEIHTFSFKKIHLKLSSGKWLPFCLGLNVLMVLVGLTLVELICTLGYNTKQHKPHHYL